MESTSSYVETQRASITSIYSALSRYTFSQLAQHSELVLQLESLDSALVKELHPNHVEIERLYEAFRQDLVLYRAWERLHLYRMLGEFDLSRREETASRIYAAVTRHVMLATDACEPARRDVLEFGDGLLIRYGTLTPTLHQWTIITVHICYIIKFAYY